ncbi:MAG: energy transducer TonB [Flavobacteriales bacterium]|nr:energy transducer TonB [Flavobacteriales bacterium]MBK6945150.1 energy transducer TonB [Flavobacteriales bacterium]MBK7239499.1 energy transducer TonB [Flavobacteriales bacterium]MBK9535296.1 energy transducer TonB [Flavobacteriales bacterium]MBP9138806.1 energy transducer TonB [Flavobacteriales bacterium]
MKIPVVLFLHAAFSVACVAQDTTYFKDFGRSFQVDEQNAKYMEVVSLTEDSVTSYMLSEYPKGKPMDEKHYRGEYPVGVWRSYDHKGKLLAERNFDKLVYTSCASKITDGRLVPPDTTKVQVQPEFKGGLDELYKFLGTTVRYPQEAKEAGIMGKVYVEAIITEAGKWETQCIKRSADPYLDYEAWRVLELMPDWTPGTQDSEPVRVRYILPMNFTLG